MSFPGILFYDSLINKMKLIAREPCLYHLAIESIERFNTEFFFFFHLVQNGAFKNNQSPWLQKSKYCRSNSN